MYVFINFASRFYYPFSSHEAAVTNVYYGYIVFYITCPTLVQHLVHTVYFTFTKGRG